MAKKKKEQIDYQWYNDFWKEYFLSKGFVVKFDEDDVMTYAGCQPEVRIQIYAGHYRTDTKTGGCICGDFAQTWNKVSQCPIYFDLDVKEEKLWRAIELLMEAGLEFSEHCGHIVEQNGGLICDPPIHNLKEKVRYNNK